MLGGWEIQVCKFRFLYSPINTKMHTTLSKRAGGSLLPIHTHYPLTNVQEDAPSPAIGLSALQTSTGARSPALAFKRTGGDLIAHASPSPHPLSKRVGVDFITYHHPLRSPNDHEMSARPTPPNVREGISSPTCTHLHIGSANEREGSPSPSVKTEILKKSTEVKFLLEYGRFSHLAKLQ